MAVYSRSACQQTRDLHTWCYTRQRIAVQSILRVCHQRVTRSRVQVCLCALHLWTFFRKSLTSKPFVSHNTLWHINAPNTTGMKINAAGRPHGWSVHYHHQSTQAPSPALCSVSTLHCISHPRSACPQPRSWNLLQVHSSGTLAHRVRTPPRTVPQRPHPRLPVHPPAAPVAPVAANALPTQVVMRNQRLCRRSALGRATTDNRIPGRDRAGLCWRSLI